MFKVTVYNKGPTVDYIVANIVCTNNREWFTKYNIIEHSIIYATE